MFVEPDGVFQLKAVRPSLAPAIAGVVCFASTAAPPGANVFSHTVQAVPLLTFVAQLLAPPPAVRDLEL